MESAPLTKAHARVLHDSSKPEAYEEAADEFSNAAKDSADPEALRVLGLLEQNHRQLARIVRSRSKHGGDARNDTTTSPEGPEPEVATAQPQDTTPQPEAEPRPSQVKDAVPRTSSPVLHGKQRRQTSSALASTLASARGIPQRQASEQGQRRNASGVGSKDSVMYNRSGDTVRSASIQSQRGPRSLDSTDSNQGRSSSTKPGGSAAEAAIRNSPQAATGANNNESPTTEDPFTKFYSTFGGLFSKLSSPLAFTGLPLVTDSTSTAPKTDHTGKPIPGAFPDPSSSAHDLNKVFSKAAIRAVEDANGPMSNFNPSAVSDSFYVVPTGGGTLSYAGVVSRTDRQHMRRKSQGSALDQGDEDDTVDQFEDARESPGSPDVPGKQRSKSQPYGSRKTVEELEMENKSLKDVITTLSNRLYMWEKSAQDQSMALHQSIRTLQPPQTPAAGVSEPGAVPANNEDRDAASKRIKELEEQVQASQREVEKYGRENEKLKSVVVRYRERWEKLKEGAKGRVRGDGADKGSDANKTEAL